MKSAVKEDDFCTSLHLILSGGSLKRVRKKTVYFDRSNKEGLSLAFCRSAVRNRDMAHTNGPTGGQHYHYLMYVYVHSVARTKTIRKNKNHKLE